MTQFELLERMKALLSLVDNPEPGLSTWHMACQQTVEQIFVGIYEASGPNTRKELLKKIRKIK